MAKDAQEVLTEVQRSPLREGIGGAAGTREDEVGVTNPPLEDGSFDFARSFVGGKVKVVVIAMWSEVAKYSSSFSLI